MKTMRFMMAAACLLFAASFAVMSCSKSDTTTCKNTCQNGGTCVNGTCQCPAGFSGESCEIKALTRFVGNWTVTENLSLDGTDTVLDNSGYVIAMSAANNTTPSDLLIDNVANAGNIVRLKGSVSGTSLTVAADTIDGKIYAIPQITYTNDSTLNIRFKVTDAASGTLEKDRTATLSK